MSDTDQITTEAPATSPGPEAPEAVRAEVPEPEALEPEGSLADQAAEDAGTVLVDRATYDARFHAALPGVDTSGARAHRPLVNDAR